MFELKKNCRNISNFFVETANIGKELGRVISSVHDSIFGMEMELNERGVKTFAITPPHVRLTDTPFISSRKGSVNDFTFYEGYLSRSYILPLCEGLRGQFIEDLTSISMYEGEEVIVQLLLKRRKGWKNQALDMYYSYLQGNDDPSASRVTRKVQDKVLHFIDRLVTEPEPRDYIVDIEEKLKQVCYQFQLRIAVKSGEPESIKQEIETAIQKYDSFNTIRVSKVKHKHMEQMFTDCIMTPDTADQLISEREMFSLLGEPEITSPEKPLAAPVTKVNNIIDVFPILPKQAAEEDTEVVHRLAEALKRVGVISQARLYNETVTYGVRLIVIQCDIPKDKNLSDIKKKCGDIKAALGVESLEVEQGDQANTVRFILPQEKPSIVSLRELIEREEFKSYSKEKPLAFPAGLDEVGNPIYLSLAELRHILIAGTTGSGKSVFLNTIITSLIAFNSPDKLRMSMIDPKLVELQEFEPFPHVDKMVVDMKKAETVLSDLVEEMEKRYIILREAKVKNIQQYHSKGKAMPYIVCVIDEYADLVAVHKDVDKHVERLGQKARAAGIHLILATQRPSADVMSGRIKANIPNCISFNLNNNTNYKTVFGTGIPYSSLLGKGDGVMRIEGSSKEFQRFQSAIVSPDASEEERVYEELLQFFDSKETLVAHQIETGSEDTIEGETEEPTEEETELDKLKRVIATTGETRIEPLRRQIGVKNIKMKDLMRTLVEEGWLLKHKEKAKGHELIASEEELSKWRH